MPQASTGQEEAQARIATEYSLMPYLDQSQMDEIEHTWIDLLEQLEEETKRANAAERELRDFRTRNPDVI